MSLNVAIPVCSIGRRGHGPNRNVAAEIVAFGATMSRNERQRYATLVAQWRALEGEPGDEAPARWSS